MFFHENIACVMVCFNPVLEDLKKSIESVLDNNVDLIIIDNGSENQNALISFLSIYKSIHFIGLEKNKGIAVAQNIGIKFAIDERLSGCIWLSDQDTHYPENFVKKMLNCFHSMDQSTLESLAVLAPSFYDKTLQAVQPVYKMNPFTTSYIPHQGLNEATHVIASGMFIPSQVFKKIGLNNEELFIDWVDTEWCWRAVNKYKLRIYVTGDVQIDHLLGDFYRKFFGKKFTLRSPFRHYFMVRNGIYLAFYSTSMTMFSRVEIIAKSLVRVFLFPVIAPNNKVEHFIATFTGLIHGVTKKLGPRG